MIKLSEELYMQLENESSSLTRAQQWLVQLFLGRMWLRGAGADKKY